jgi:DNA-damage-inducible protein D
LAFIWNEYWSVRELYKILEYTEYTKFLPTIKKAEIACKTAKESVIDHFAHMREMVEIWSGAKREVDNILLPRFACYLIIQNADASKEMLALWQRYFAIQTRKQEVQDDRLEDSKRKILRDEMKQHNIDLAGAAKKWLKKSQKILDHMSSEELAANLFRATQAEAKLNRENIQWKDNANKAHHQVWEEVRQTIKNLGGTMPEELPANDSIKQIEKRLKDTGNKNILWK